MTPFVSVAVIRREGEIVFRRPRKERPETATQARKAAARFWSRTLASDDRLIKLIVLRERAGIIEIGERTSATPGPWTEYTASVQEAYREPHLAACLGEIGIDATFAPPEVPDILIINGHTYRRDL